MVKNNHEFDDAEVLEEFDDGRPLDRLTTEGVFNLPPLKSLYHTERAECARQRAMSELPEELASAQKTLLDAGLRRMNPSYADVADHNAMTLAYAFKYVDCGLHVIDAHAIDAKTGKGTDPQGLAKLPRGSKWQDRASNDSKEIECFWTGEGEYPPTKTGEVYDFAGVGAPRNVSIAFPEGCGLFVLDIDGEAGKAALAELEAEHGALPRTAKSITGSGGWHFIFRTQRAIRNTASQIAPGVDIRGSGGQIVAAPSIHKTGNFYQWQDGCAPWDGITDAPEWLEELAVNASKHTGKGKGKGSKTAKTTTRRRSATAKARVSEARGFEDILATIGDHGGGEGFDTPINRAACSWFSMNGTDADSSELFDILRVQIDEAERDPNRDRGKYDTDEYLSERIKDARAHIKKTNPAAIMDRLLTQAQNLDEDTDDGAVYSLMEDALEHAQAIGLTGKNRLFKVIAENTALKKTEVSAMWKACTRTAQGDASDTESAVINEWDFRELCDHGSDRLHSANKQAPFIFHFLHDLCVIRAGSDGRLAIQTVNRGIFANLLNTAATFVKVTGDDGRETGVSAPYDVVEHLFSADRSVYPPLRGVVTTPAFTANGTMLKNPGYDWDSQVYFQPDPSFSIPAVSELPAPEEVFEAKRLLVQEILADFMLDGMNRAETIKAALGCEEVDGELRPLTGAEAQPTPSLAHAVVMALFPFVREMIHGNAPGIAIDKQKPGAGAGKLEAAMSMIFAGRATSAMALPTTPEEMTKVLLPALRSGDPNVFFDNVSQSVDSGELASAMTAPTYRARVLGKSETVEVDVRCQWVIAGIKLKLSEELTRRFALIYLDPKTANPEARTGFRHAEIEGWVTENRGKLIWACLTLIQNWLATGAKPGTKDKASYSHWARVMGGILEAADIKGFLDNESDMKARSSASEDPVRQLIERLATEFEDGQLFVTGSVAKRHPNGTVSIKETLEEFHGDESGDAQCLRLPGWGYDSLGTYASPQKLGSGFKRDVAGEPHRVADWEITFDPEANTSGSNLWKMSKRKLG